MSDAHKAFAREHARALRLADRLSAATPWLASDIRSDVGLGLWAAAMRYGHLPEREFRAYVNRITRLCVIESRKDGLPLGFRRSDERKQGGAVPRTITHVTVRGEERPIWDVLAAPRPDGDAPANEDVRAAFDRLTDRQQAVLRLRYAIGEPWMKRGDVASTLGVTADCLDGLVAKAKKRLRANLEEESIRRAAS